VLVLGTFPYNLVLSAAAVRAVWRELRGERGWEKTAHVGAHRGPDALVAVERRLPDMALKQEASA